MTARDYATLDRNRMGPALLLDGSDLQLTTSIACDANRTVLGNLPALSGDFAYEIYFWSTSRASLAGLLSYGVATADVDLAARLGTDSAGAGYGFAAADGLVQNNSSTIETVQEQGERIALGCHLSLSPSEATCEFLVSGNVVSTIDLPTGVAWYPALSIGGASAGDLVAGINFGQWRFDRLAWRNGWSQQTAGLATITLALVAEGFQTTATDMPPNTPYGPYVLNAGDIAVRRSTLPWHLRDDGNFNPAALTTLTLDNRGNRFAALLGADVKDSVVVLQVIDAPPGGVGVLTGAETIMTGIVEGVQRTKKGQIELTLRDTLTRFDRQMRMRRIAPYWDATAAGKVVPFGRGAQRNVQPILLDAPTRLYLLADVPQTNVTQVSDEGAPLDPNALPPQWTGALDHEGIQLATDAVGRVSSDCSSVGQQYDIPGAADVLDGIGAFSPWAVAVNTPTTTPPDGWLFSNESGSQLSRRADGSINVARIRTTRPWYPHTSPIYGDYLVVDGEPLLGGRSYRITFRLVAAVANDPTIGGPGNRGGFMLRTALSNDPRDAVTSHGVAIQTPSLSTGVVYSIDFTAPLGDPRPVYLIAVASSGLTAGSGTGICYIDIENVKIELLGQFVSLPLDSIGPTALMQDILVDIEGEDPSVFSSADTDAIFAAAGFGIGIRREDTPNLLDLMTEIADQYGAVLFTDELGQIRMRRFLMPEDAGAIVASFSRANVDLKSVRIYPAEAPGLTTQFWCRPNCTPFADGDLVSDTDVVTPAMRAAFKDVGQFSFSTSAQTAREYIRRVDAQRRLLLVDDLAPAKAEAERVVAQMARKRMVCEFVATFERMTLGLGPTVKPHQLYPVDKILVDLPEFDLPSTLMRVIDTAPQSLGGKITIAGIY